MRQRPARHLPPKRPGQRPGSLSRRHRGARTGRSDRQRRAGRDALCGRRPGARVSHRRVRSVPRLPARLDDLLHLAHARRLRLATRRRARAVHAGRGAHARAAPGELELRGRRAGRLRFWDGLRRAYAGGRVRPRCRARHRARSGRPGRGPARPGLRRAGPGQRNAPRTPRAGREPGGRGPEPRWAGRGRTGPVAHRRAGRGSRH